MPPVPGPQEQLTGHSCGPALPPTLAWSLANSLVAKAPETPNHSRSTQPLPSLWVLVHMALAA